MLKTYQKDPFLLYYQAKYMLKLLAYREALTIVNSIVQYNHYEIWILAANLHIEMKNYNEVLVCLNHASKLTGKSTWKNEKNLELCYK